MSAQIDQIKKEMKATAKKVNFWLKIVFVGLLLCLVVGIGCFFGGYEYWVFGSIFSGIPLVLLVFALSGLMIVQPEDRIMIEFLGKPYCIKKSGLRWACPVLMKKRMRVSTWEQPVYLFPERRYPNGIHIDLKNGGKTELVDPILWIQLVGGGTDEEEDNILRMIYAIEDWEDAVQENGENALRTHLNNLTVDEVLAAIHVVEKESWWEAISEYFPKLGETFGGYGIEVKRLTISDFNWDKKVVEARQKIFEEERSIEHAKLSVKAAADEVMQKALESGGQYGNIVKLLMQKKYGELTKAEAMKVAETLVLYYKGADTKSLVDVRAGSENSFAPLISAVVAAMRGIKVGDKKPEKPSVVKSEKTEKSSTTSTKGKEKPLSKED